MTQAVKAEEVDHPPILCVLEMKYDGFLSVTRQPGCSQDDLYEILRLLTQSDGPFSHLTILPEAAEDDE